MVPFHILDDLDAGFLFTQLPFLSGHGLFGFFQTSRKFIKTGFGSRALFLDTLLLVFCFCKGCTAVCQAFCRTFYLIFSKVHFFLHLGQAAMELFFFLMGGVKVIAQRYKFPHTFKIFVLGIFPTLFTCCHKARQFILFLFRTGKGRLHCLILCLFLIIGAREEGQVFLICFDVLFKTRHDALHLLDLDLSLTHPLTINARFTDALAARFLFFAHTYLIGAKRSLMSLELLIFGIDFRLELSRLFVKASFLFPPPFKTRFNIALFRFQVVQPAHKLRYTHQFIASIQFLIGTNLFRCLFKGLQLAGNFRLDIVDPQEVSCRIIELSQGLFFTETIFGNACRFLKNGTPVFGTAV